MSLKIPDNPNQWYIKYPSLFREEVIGMEKLFPNAILGFFKKK